MEDLWKSVDECIDKEKLYYTLQEVIKILNKSLNLKKGEKVRYHTMKYYLDNGYIKYTKKSGGYFKFIVTDIYPISELVFYTRVLGIPVSKINRLKEYINKLTKE